jgi:hypothetical protein
MKALGAFAPDYTPWVVDSENKGLRNFSTIRAPIQIQNNFRITSSMSLPMQNHRCLDGCKACFVAGDCEAYLLRRLLLSRLDSASGLLSLPCSASSRAIRSSIALRTSQDHSRSTSGRFPMRFNAATALSSSQIDVCRSAMTRAYPYIPFDVKNTPAGTT